MNFLFSLLRLIPGFLQWMREQQAAELAELEQKAKSADARWEEAQKQIATLQDQVGHAMAERNKFRANADQAHALWDESRKSEQAMRAQLAEAKEQIKAMTPDEIAQKL